MTLTRPRIEPVLLAVVAMVAAAVGACSTAADTADEPTTFTSVEADGDGPPPLEVLYQSEGIYCDGTAQPVAVIRGAEPGEVLRFGSALPLEIEDGAADADGRYLLNWACAPEESRLRWDLTVTGADSGRTGTIGFAATESDPDGTPLTMQLVEEPFLCDGGLRVLGTLTGATPDEAVEVTSTHTGSTEHKADGLGSVELWWSCNPDDGDATWEVQANTDAPPRTVRFMVTGRAPRPGEIPPLTVAVTEDPFLCDGGNRTFGTIANFVAFEPVDFSAPGVDVLIPGRADENGALEMRWECGLAEVDRTWELTATGRSSRRTITFSFQGGPPAPGSIIELELATVAEDPFICDGGSRSFATIANFTPGEYVRFTSPQAENLREGQADGQGLLPIRWQCDGDDIGTVWQLTAVGQTSGKSITLSVTGAAPS